MRPRGLAVLAGIIWMALAVPLFLIAPMALMVGSGSAIYFIAIATASLALGAALILKPTARPPLVASLVLGLVLAVLAVLASQEAGPWPTLVYAAFAASAAVISGIVWLATRAADPSRRQTPGS